MKIVAFCIIMFISLTDIQAQSSMSHQLKFIINKGISMQSKLPVTNTKALTYSLLNENAANELDLITHKLVITTLAYDEEGGPSKVIEDVMLAASLFKKENLSKVSFIKLAITDLNFLISSSLCFKFQLAVKL